MLFCLLGQAGRADLWFAAIAVFVLSACLFLITNFVTKGWSKKWIRVFVAIITFAIIASALWLNKSCSFINILPLRAVIIYANILPLLAAVLVALVWRAADLPAWRKTLVLVPFLVATCLYSFSPIWSRSPDCLDVWDGDVCLQSRRSTCSAAAAATLLKFHGIDTNEQEMANLCLTTAKGTNVYGLYRGLRIAVEAEKLNIKAGFADLESLQRNVRLPAILNVKLTKEVHNRDPRYAGDWQWQVGVSHTVVLFGFKENGLIDIGDPGVGREDWNIQALKDLWHGVYLTVEKK